MNERLKSNDLVTGYLGLCDALNKPNLSTERLTNLKITQAELIGFMHADDFVELANAMRKREKIK